MQIDAIPYLLINQFFPAPFSFDTGVGFFYRKLGNTVQPTVELKKAGDQYTLLTTSTFKNSEIHFELGKEFDEETLDGRQVKSVITLEGNKLIHKQGGDPPSEIIREFGEKEMVATMKAKDVTSIRKYSTEAVWNVAGQMNGIAVIVFIMAFR